jgi:hypothetical protein
MVSDHIIRNAVRKALDHIEVSSEKRNCCEPYDCMHHEMCGEESYGECSTCKAEGATWWEYYRYTRKRNVDRGMVWALAEKAVEEDRMAYYRETRYNDRAPAHWSDGGGYAEE